MSDDWITSVTDHYTTKFGFAPQVFRQNFERLKPKIILHGRVRRSLYFLKIKELVRDEDVLVVAALCAFVEGSVLPHATDCSKIPFDGVFSVVPDEMEPMAHARILAEGNVWGPLILCEHVDSHTVLHIYYSGGIVDGTTSCCTNACDALETLFKIYVVYEIDFPPTARLFFEFVNYFIACGPPRDGWLEPCKAVKNFHETLKGTSMRSIWRSLNL